VTITACPPPFADVASQAAAVRSGETSARELVEATLHRIDVLDPRLNAFIRVLREQALDEADERDRHVARGRPLGPLHGVPIAIKDDIDVAGVPTTYGSAGSTVAASADSEVVRRLRAAGAVIVGKTTMPEFGLWPFTESRAYGYTRNPWDVGRSTAGSSGGSAAAVASGMVSAAIGGDGGGSIRLPAAHCGLFGLKPQRGRVSTAPGRDLWRSLGVLGPLTRTVADSALIFDVIRGSLARERWRAEPPRMTFVEAAATPPQRLRIAVSLRPPLGGVDVDPDIVAAIDAVAEILSELGHSVTAADPRYPDMTSAFLPQLLAGVRHAVTKVDRPKLVERRTQKLAALGKFASGPRVLAWAEHQGRRVASEVNQIFSRFDLLLMPTVAMPAVALGQLDDAGLVGSIRKSLPLAVFTTVWNVCGNPAASVPAGMSADGRPLSVQLVAAPSDETTILQVATQLEGVLRWPELRPPAH
jgi:amidase